MMYLLSTTIDCKACLDSVLLSLVPFASVLGFRDSNESVDIIIKCSLKIEELIRHVQTVEGVSFEILKYEELHDANFEKLLSEFELYTSSFWEK